MNRTERRQRDNLTRQLRAHIAEHGIETDARQDVRPGQLALRRQRTVMDRARCQDAGPGRAYCVRANGDWFKAIGWMRHTQ